MEIPSKDICVQVYFPQVTKNSQTNCQCVSSQFIASKTQETHSRGNTVNHDYFIIEANTTNPDQTAPKGGSLVRVHIVCYMYMYMDYQNTSADDKADHIYPE